jgi:CubicO group peptidase (beta-lactamase class C family)
VSARIRVALLLGVILLVAGAVLWLVRGRGPVTEREARNFQPRELVPGGNQPPAPRESPDSEQLDGRALASAADYAGRHGSRALIVSRHGYLVFERYWQGTSFDSVADAQDFTPLLAALATGVAMSHRQIGWPDEPVGAFFSEWRQDPRGTITLRQLLQSSSGLAPPAGVPTDLSVAALAAPLGGTPGAQRAVNPLDAQLLSMVLEHATHQRYASYVSQALWRRLGAGDAWLWLDHKGGSAHADCCMLARQGDWIRVAELMLSEGRYQGAEVIRPGWIGILRTPAKSDPDYGAFVRIANKPRAGQESYATRDLFVVGGRGGNRLWLSPSMQLAILCTGPPAGRDADWDDSRIPNLILRGARDYQPPPPLPGDINALVPGH